MGQISDKYKNLMIAAVELLRDQEPGSATANMVKSALENEADYLKFLALTADQGWDFTGPDNVASFTEWSRLYAGALYMLPDDPASAKMTCTVLGGWVVV